MESRSRNIYKTARNVAGLTQERWAETIGVSPDSVRKYESGDQIPHDDVVKMMSEISGLSPLCYWHLCHKSEIAKELLPPVETVPLPQAVIQLTCRIRDFAKRPDRLLDIVADGKIDEFERSDFDTILAELDDVVQAAIQLKYAERGE